MPHIQTIVTALLIMYLSLTEQVGGAERIHRLMPYSDKVAHFIMYFVLTLVLIISYRGYVACRLQVLMLVLGVFLYGVLMEILQKYVTINRHFEWWDMAANLIGIMAALLLIQIIVRVFPGKRESGY